MIRGMPVVTALVGAAVIDRAVRQVRALGHGQRVQICAQRERRPRVARVEIRDQARARRCSERILESGQPVGDLGLGANLLEAQLRVLMNVPSNPRELIAVGIDIGPECFGQH